MFDKMNLVVGKDMTTRNFSKAIGDIDAEPMADSTLIIDLNPIDFDIDLDNVSKRKQVNSSIVASTQTMSHRKQNRASMNRDVTFMDLLTLIGKVAYKAKNQLSLSNLYEEVMKVRRSV